jgi:hypothetical protein
MNRYLLRSLVALSTFLLSIAVNAVIHPFGLHRWEHRYSRFEYRERRCSRTFAYPRPALSIDAVATDPVKLVYSQNQPPAYSSPRQVTFLLDNQTAKPVKAVVVQYSWRWPEKDSWEIETVRVSPVSSNVEDQQTLTLDCGDQTLWIWISSVEFKDGSHWFNPRHSIEQSF